MTKDKIKKALECCDSHMPSACGDCPYCWVEECKDKLIADVLTLITEQGKSIQVAQDNILAVAQQNQECREQQVKQAKIDVLNKAREKLDSAPNGWAYTTYIDEIIEEVENDK